MYATLTKSRVRNLIDAFMWRITPSSGMQPHSIKRKLLRELGARYDLSVLVESGTYLGHMIDAQKNYFSHIISIELSESLCAFARKRFANVSHVELIHGDSGEVIDRIVQHMDAPALFWLDGHYSGGITAKGAKETPVVSEVLSIMRHAPPKSVIVVDDARCFGELPDYPTEAEFKALVDKNAQSRSFSKIGDAYVIGPALNGAG